MIRFKLAETENRIGFALDSNKASLVFKIAAKGVDVPAYTGGTIVTPTTEAQTLHTANKKVLENITIEPIPSNYGLVTWNGSNLMIS